ncbi:MAG: flavin reductase family protein [Ktedonobacterales bacterium]
MPVDPSAFRAVLGRFATGVTVVTTCQGTRRAGITVNAFTSVSLDPPLVLVCIDRSSHVHDVLLESGIFAVNILSHDQMELSSCFAGTTDFRYNEFCGATSHTEATGAPVLDESLGFVDCRIVDVYPGGDHSILVGQVEALGGAAGEPLLYYRSHYLDSPERTR